MLTREITLEALLQDGDWAQVFGDESYGNTNKDTRAAVPDPSIDLTPPSRTDIKEIVAVANGEPDAQEWIGLFVLFDGRYLVANGGCDYTGWDCQASNTLVIARDQEEAVMFALTREQRKRLGICPECLGIGSTEGIGNRRDMCPCGTLPPI
jgi:hypothetical protein